MACTTHLQGFTTSCGSNLASIKKIYVGAFESATFTFNYQEADNSTESAPVYITDADGNRIIETVATAALKANEEAWVEFGFKKNTGSMTSELTVNDNGSVYYTNAANLVFAKQDKTKRLAIQATASGECAMVVLDSNGIYWLIGNDTAVTATSMSATTGTAVSDSNQYELTLGADEGYMPIPLDATTASTIIAALQTPANTTGE